MRLHHHPCLALVFGGAAVIQPPAIAGVVAVNGDTTLEGGWGLFETLCPYGPLEVLVSDAGLWQDISSIPSSMGDVLLDPEHNVRKVGSGWGTWSHGYTGQLFFVMEDEATYWMPSGVGAFDAYVEPGPFQWEPFLMTAYASDGTTAVIEDSIHGESGASHFGFYTTGGATLVKVRVEVLASVSWAIGELRIAATSCPGDTTGDGVVDVLDLLKVLAEWGQHAGAADLTGDGVVDVLDLLEVLAAWGSCP